MEEYKFRKLTHTGQYIVYNEEAKFHEYVDTKEEATDLRNKMNRDADGKLGDSRLIEEKLQKDFEKAIRERQANDKRCLNQEDVVLALNSAMNTIIKENSERNDVLCERGENGK